MGKLPRTILEGLANKEHSFKLVEERTFYEGSNFPRKIRQASAMPHRSFYVGSNFLREILGASTNISVICHYQYQLYVINNSLPRKIRGASVMPHGKVLLAWRLGKNYPSGLKASTDQSIWLKGCYIFETSHQHEERLKHASGQRNSSSSLFLSSLFLCSSRDCIIFPSWN